MAEWKVKRAEADYLTAQNLDQLRVWAKHARVLPTDYVLNPVLNQWVYARDVAELGGYFPAAAPQSAVAAAPALASVRTTGQPPTTSLSKASCSGGFALMLFGIMLLLWRVPFVGIVLLFLGCVAAAVGIIAAVMNK